MKYVVECEDMKDYSSEFIICDSLAEACKEAVLFGTSFMRDPVRGALTLCDTATVYAIYEECLNETAFGDDGSIDWRDFDPNAAQVVYNGFSGRSLASLVIEVYPAVYGLESKEDMLTDAAAASLKSLCNEAYSFGKSHPSITFLNGDAESCVDAFNDVCRQLNICRRHRDGSSEILRVDFPF